ncbi:hypothetical protein ACOMHN_007929 [Nucella lapillus]
MSVSVLERSSVTVVGRSVSVLERSSVAVVGRSQCPREVQCDSGGQVLGPCGHPPVTVTSPSYDVTLTGLGHVIGKPEAALADQRRKSLVLGKS